MNRDSSLLEHHPLRAGIVPSIRPLPANPVPRAEALYSQAPFPWTPLRTSPYTHHSLRKVVARQVSGNGVGIVLTPKYATSPPPTRLRGASYICASSKRRLEVPPAHSTPNAIPYLPSQRRRFVSSNCQGYQGIYTYKPPSPTQSPGPPGSARTRV